MDFRITNFDEGVFILNEDISFPKDREILINVKVFPIFRYSADMDVVVCQLTLKYYFEKTNLLTYGFAVAFGVKGWIDFISTNPDRQAIIDEIFNMWNASVNVGRGVLIDKTKNTQLKQFPIPDISKEKLNAILQIEQISNSKEQ